MDPKDKKQHSSRGSISEQFAYTFHLGAYPNNSDMNELSEIPQVRGEKNA